MNITASRTYIKMSPRKLREVADLIRGKDARVALASLQFVRRLAAEPMGLVLRQAIANASQSGVQGKLIISKLLVDEGPVAKRFRPISRGQAHPIQKYSSHIKIELKVLAPSTIKSEAKSKSQVIKVENKESAKESISKVEKTIVTKKNKVTVKANK